MFQNFESTKRHLAELAEIINKFKSETVQLRIVDLLFKNDSTTNNLPNQTESTPTATKSKAKRRAKSRAVKQPSLDTVPKKKTSAGSGAISTLRKIFADGYFNQARSIGDICKHCEINLARKIKPNDISGTLARMVRSNELSRIKNSDNQYIYSKV